MKEKYGITCEEALKAFSDLGETLRKGMVKSEKKSTPFKPVFTSYAYTCPECGEINSSEQEVTMIRCEKCYIIFNPQIQAAMKESEKENPYLRMSAYPMEDFGKPDDWKILDVNCLPEKFDKKEKYEVEYDAEFGCFLKSNDYVNGDYITVIKKAFEGKTKYRYRPTPTKKSHEELAIDFLKTFDCNTSTEQNIAIQSFIAGRKSMESES